MGDNNKGRDYFLGHDHLRATSLPTTKAEPALISHILKYLMCT